MNEQERAELYEQAKMLGLRDVALEGLLAAPISADDETVDRVWDQVWANEKSGVMVSHEQVAMVLRALEEDR